MAALSAFLTHVCASLVQMKDVDSVVDYNQQCDSFGVSEIAMETLASMPYDQRAQTGHRLDAMLLSCAFEGYPCTSA